MKTVWRIIILCLVLVTIASVSDVMGQMENYLGSLGILADNNVSPGYYEPYRMGTNSLFHTTVIGPVVDLNPSSQMYRNTAYFGSFAITSGFGSGIGGGLYGNVSYPTNLLTKSLTSDLSHGTGYGSGWGSYGDVSYPINPATSSLTSDLYHAISSGGIHVPTVDVLPIFLLHPVDPWPRPVDLTYISWKYQFILNELQSYGYN